MNKSVSRRTFVGIAGTTLACTALGFGAAAVASPSTALLRPPGAQDETRFIALCIKCDRCRSACPADAIQTAPLETGIATSRTPLMNFHRGSCDFCGLCERVCPTGAIGPFDPETGKIGVAVVQEDRCIAYEGGCVECVDACPYEAISLNAANHPVVDPHACNGCGLCETICPALVYRSFGGGTRRGIEIVPVDSSNETHEGALR